MAKDRKLKSDKTLNFSGILNKRLFQAKAFSIALVFLLLIGLVGGEFIPLKFLLKSPHISSEVAQAAGEAPWYNPGWNYRIKITVRKAKVDADINNYPVYVDLADLPAGFHTNVNQTDARDIRVTKSDGITEVPREVVFYTSGATPAGELYFKGDIKNALDVDFYIYYGNAGAADYAAGDAYGSQNVWEANTKMVQHMKENPAGTAPQMKDSTQNANNGTSGSTMTAADLVAGKIGRSLNFDRSADDYIEIGAAGLDISSNITISSWVNWTGALNANPQMAIGRGADWRLGGKGGIGNKNWGFYGCGGNPFLCPLATYGGAGVWAPNNIPVEPNGWHYMVYTYDGSLAKIYLDGVGNQLAVSGALGKTKNVFIGAQSNTSNLFGGKIDEVRIYDRVLSAQEITTQYNNQNDPYVGLSNPANFYDIGVEQNITSLTPLAIRNVFGWAWSENIGWISFNSKNCNTDGDATYEGSSETGAPVPFPADCPTSGSAVPYGATVNLSSPNKELSGYAWSPNIGWITFEKLIAGTPPGAPYNNSSQDYIANVDGSNNVIGWARALAAMNNGGGWDGWIKLSNNPAYGTKLNGNDFEGFAWGSNMVVGWISFNSKNCDVNNNNVIDIGEDINGCPAVTTIIPAYKVYLPGTPSAANLAVSAINYCSKPTTVNLTWTYTNGGSANQDQYRIQVAIDAGFVGKVIDFTSGILSPTIIPGNQGSVSIGVVPNPTVSTADLDIAYNGTYYWQVKVHDTTGVWSDWVVYTVGSGAFTTEKQGPDINFSPPPPGSLATNIPIQFCTDNIGPDGAGPLCAANIFTTGCYDAGNNPVICATYTWDFGDGVFDPVEDIKANPAHTYSVSNPSYNITLTAGDGVRTCSKTKGLGIVKPRWKEVIPINQ